MPKNFLLTIVAAVGMACAALPALAADPMPDVAGTSYFPVLPFEAAPEAVPQLVPLAGNHTLDSNHAGLTSAIIVVHDFTRDAQATLAMVSSLAGANNASTIILAPQFLIDFDIARFADRLPERGKMFARWALGGWENGGDSIARAPQKPVSAFTTLDLLLLYLGDRQFFPDLKRITVAGHGAGGDFVQRYAAAGRAMDILEKQNVPVRFLVANASSYLYLTTLRPKGGRQQGFTNATAAACPDFNSYGYGLEKLNDYVRRVGANDIKLKYATREITYLVGEKAGTGDPFPETGCAAMLQGLDRPARALNYSIYLSQLYGELISGKQKFFTVPRAGYDAGTLFGSFCGMSVLFGDGVCQTAPTH